MNIETRLSGDVAPPCILSPKTGEASGSMRGLFQHNMVGILKPINENILDLQEQVEELRGAQTEAAARDADCRSWLCRHDGELSANRDGLGSLENGVGELRTDLHEAGQRHLALDNEHGNTRRSLAEAVARIRALEEAIEALHGTFATTDAHVRDLHGRVESSSGLTCRLQATLGDFQQSHLTLQNRHLEFAKGHQQAMQNSEDAHERTKQLSNKLESQKVEITNAVKALNDRAFDVEKHTSELQEQVDFLADTNYRLDGEITTVKKSLGIIEQNLEASAKVEEENVEEEAAQRQEAQKQAQSVASRLATMTANLSECTKLLSAETEKNTKSREAVQQLSQQVSKTTTITGKNVEEINSLGGLQRRTDELVQVLEDRTKQLEERGAELAERTESAETHLTLLQAARDDVTMKIDVQALELDRGRKRHEQLRSDLVDANSALQGLNGDFVKTSAHLGHISERVSVAHEYFDGLGKGIQDTHRHAIDGTGGMLPPTPRSRTLPGIAGRGAQKSAWQTSSA